MLNIEKHTGVSAARGLIEVHEQHRVAKPLDKVASVMMYVSHKLNGPYRWYVQYENGDEEVLLPEESTTFLTDELPVNVKRFVHRSNMSHHGVLKSADGVDDIYLFRM